MAASALVGRSVKRKEDERLLRGRGRFVDDVPIAGLLHAVLVRSPHPHARVRAVDAGPARAHPGVVAVLTAADVPAARASVPALVPMPAAFAYEHPGLAGPVVRHVGEAVAVVVAADVYAAADAAELVVVDYEVLTPVVTTAEARRDEAIKVQPSWSSNAGPISAGRVGSADEGFRAAAAVVEGHFVYPRVAGMPIEPRGVVAMVDPADGRMTVWSSTQVPFAVRGAIAAALGLAEDQVRVIAPDTGGGFGVKGHVYPEEIAIPAVARHLGRPVKWIETRHEHFLAAAGDRDQDHVARLGVSRDGAITALETRFVRDHGAFPTLGEAIVLNTINHLPGPYRVPAYRAHGEHVLTHKTFLAAYRGAGRPEAALVLDRLLDRAARAIGMDPAELRRRNLIRPEEMPYRTGLSYRDGAPIVYDPADYPASFELMLRRLDYDAWRARQRAQRDGTRRLGLGLSAYTEGTGIGPFEGADIRVDANGTVFVDIGVSAQGQAHETTLAQICADRLDVPLEQVVVRGGDTQLVGYGMGTIASRVMAVAGPAVARAAGEVADKAKLVAAELFECAPADVVLAGGRVSVAGVPGKSVTLAQVARAAVRSLAVQPTGQPGLEACVFFYPGSVTWAFGAHGAVVEVDVETGALRVLRYVAVHDCGRAVNPMIVEAQIHGGVVQGLGSARSEELIHDEGGQLLTGTFMDYGLPRADEVPPLDVEALDFPSGVNELGVKGVGESGVISPAAVLANAVEDALADLGVTIDRVPLTPARVFECLQRAARRAPA